MYEILFSALNDGALSFIDNAIFKVSDVLFNTLLTMGTLYFVWCGYEMWTGKINQPIQIIFNRFLKFIFILGLLKGTELYLDVIVDTVWNTPDYIAGIFTDSNETGANLKFLDKFRDDIFILTERLADTGGWRNPKPIITAFAIEAVTILITAYAFFLFALSKVMIALLLAIGSFFIIMYLFETTQRYFEAWFNQLMNFIMIYLIVSAVLLLLSGILQETLRSALATNNISLSDIIQPLVFLVISGFVLIQITGIASALGGGVALNTGQILGLSPWRFIGRLLKGDKQPKQKKSKEQKEREKRTKSRHKRMRKYQRQSRSNAIRRKR